MIGLRKRWILEGLVLTTAGMALAGWITWIGLRHGLTLQARRQAAATIKQFEWDAVHAFHRGESLAQAVRSRLSSTPLDQLDPDDLLELVPFLENDGPITSLMVYETRGRVLFLDRRERRWVLSLHRRDGKIQRSWIAVDGKWVQHSDSTFIRNYKPETRPWHVWAMSHAQAGWMTHPYRFSTGYTCGYSYVIPLRSGGPDSPLEGVVAADIDLAPFTQETWRRSQETYRDLMALTPEGLVLLPPWDPKLASDIQALRAALLVPFTQAPRPVLLRHRATSPQLPSADILILAPIQGLHVPLWAGLAFVGLPVLATGLLLGLFVWRHHRRIMAPLADLAEAGAHPGQAAGRPVKPGAHPHLSALGQSLDHARHVEADHRTLQQRLETMQRAGTVGALAPGIVHDANNQLAVAMGQLSIVTDLLKDYPELEPFLEKAWGATLRCSEVLGALLAYSRPQPGVLTDLDLGLVVHQTAEMLQRVLGKGITLHQDLPAVPLWIRGEQVKLEQIIVNLALNARDAMPHGGKLALRAHGTGERIVLEVEDTGTGMPESVRARVFEPFFTTKAPGRGTGLGLAMVASLVQAVQGEITVTSEEGRGTTFRLSFPAAPPVDVATPASLQGT